MSAITPYRVCITFSLCAPLILNSNTFQVPTFKLKAWNALGVGLGCLAFALSFSTVLIFVATNSKNSTLRLDSVLGVNLIGVALAALIAWALVSDASTIMWLV
eukprot:Pgem_evm1s12270